MPAETRYVAVSTDRSDQEIKAGPALPVLPKPPANREWVEEFRAMAAGYWYGDEPEEWAAGAGTPLERTAPALNIERALRRHLAKSTAYLASNPTGTLVDLTREGLRRERALNLILRAMLEVFDSEPPATVMEGATDDNTTPPDRGASQSR